MSLRCVGLIVTESLPCRNGYVRVWPRSLPKKTLPWPPFPGRLPGKKIGPSQPSSPLREGSRLGDEASACISARKTISPPLIS